jgi:MOSC domain-containing protein YiiM
MAAMARVVSIVTKPEQAAPTQGAYTRVAVEEARLIAGTGIEGDQKGGNPWRQLNVMGLSSVNGLQADGFKTGPGQLGEQIVLDGLDIETLPVGTRLGLGDEAVIELLRLRDPCDRFESYQGLPLQGAIGRIGWMASVVSSGVVSTGDPVRVMEAEPALAV